MTRLLRYEWRRVRSVRSTYLFLGAVVLLSVLTILNGRGLVASSHVAASAGRQARLPGAGTQGPDLASWIETFAPAQASAGLLFMILGATAFTSEYRDRMVGTLFACCPGRVRVVLSKALILPSLAVAASLTCAATAAAGLWLGGTWHAGHLGGGIGTVSLAVARDIVVAWCYCAIGLAVGALVGRIVPAAVGTLLWALVAEPLIQVAGPVKGAWVYLLPIADAQNALSASGRAWLALGGVAAWAAALLAAGCLAVQRRDVSGDLA